MVSINTTYTRSRHTEIGGQEALLPWQPISFDAQSIVHEGSYPDMQPNWFAPPIYRMDQYADSEFVDGQLKSNTLWPTQGSSTNFFEFMSLMPNTDSRTCPDYLIRKVSLSRRSTCTPNISLNF